MDIEATSKEEITKKTTAKNIGIVASIRILSRTLTFISTIILARLLTPEDYGIVGISSFLVNFLLTFQDFGIGKAVIYQKKDIEPALFTGFTIRFVFSLILYGTVFLIAPFWAQGVGDSRVTVVLRVISLLFVIESFMFVPWTIARKELRFKKTFLPQTLRVVAAALSSITLAYLGFSYWSLVYGQLLGATVAVFAWKHSIPWKLSFRYEKAKARELIAYGKHIFISGAIIFLLKNLDNALIGFLMGLEELGYYNMAYRFATFTIPLITVVVSNVIFPTLTKINEDPELVKKAYLKALELISFLVIPFAILLAALAPEFVLIFLGEKWEDSIVPLQILAFAGMFRALTATSGQVFLATGNTRWYTGSAVLRFSLFLVFIYPLMILFGLMGVAITVVIFTLAGMLYAFFGLGRILEIKKRIFAGIIGRNLLSAAVAAGFLFLVRTRLELTLPTFVLTVTGGLGVYLVLIHLATRGRFLEELKELLGWKRRVRE